MKSQAPKFKVGDRVVRCANGNPHASVEMKDGVVGEIIAMTSSGDITFDNSSWWDKSYFRLCEDYVVNRILTKYSAL